ncbi:hypothetical protein TEA_009594 [Camellia sinensis var. sinensis]|uniref:Uncharacterized protein n=1 Tax=Camellia sinensis var. sinensis TaxID=542762 RepID=A0A4S4DVE9_CAMSN|nr:hypothetical protein TEA_009594 [Camellia sinensis var. sinensis]
MTNYHFMYKNVEGASTQQDDVQRKLGNLPRKPPVFKPPSFKPAEDEDSKHKDKAWIDDTTEEQLQDDPDLDDDRFLQEYMYHFLSSDSPNYANKRLGELRQAAKVQRYGSVVPISGSDFVREIAKDVEDVKSAPVMESLRPCKDVELSPSKDVEPRPFMDIDSQKKIVALKNENSELSKKLDVALGKIEAPNDDQKNETKEFYQQVEDDSLAANTILVLTTTNPAWQLDPLVRPTIASQDHPIIATEEGATGLTVEEGANVVLARGDTGATTNLDDLVI